MATFSALMQLFLTILTQIKALDKAKVVRINLTLITLVVLLTLMFTWNYQILYFMAVNEVSLIVVEGNQLLDVTIVASLAIF